MQIGKKRNMQAISKIIRNRRSVFPSRYTDKPIERAIIEEILENANCAPNHRNTEPWRFKVFQDDALQKLSDYLGDTYEATTPKEKFSEMKLKKIRKKPLQSQCIIAICMQRDPKASVPEWEEIAAVSCAVQNMWLTCSAYDIGSYWSSPASIINAREFLGLKEGERCLGLFYMGYAKDVPTNSTRRQAIEEKVEWL